MQTWESFQLSRVPMSRAFAFMEAFLGRLLKCRFLDLTARFTEPASPGKQCGNQQVSYKIFMNRHIEKYGGIQPLHFTDEKTA